MSQDDYCCRDGCCGPGSWCCGHARPHTHEDEPDDREALADLASRAIVDAWTDEGENVAAPYAVADAIIAAGFHRHPEPVKPSREDVAAAIRHATDDGADRSEDYADAVLALWPGRSVAEVKAEALREAVEAHAITIPDVLGYKVPAVTTEDLLDRADRLERVAP